MNAIYAMLDGIPYDIKQHTGQKLATGKLFYFFVIIYLIFAIFFCLQIQTAKTLRPVLYYQ